MRTQILVTLVAVAIQACPFVCRATVTVDAKHPSSAPACCHGCCGHCPGETDEAHGDPSAPLTPSPESGCHCICCGAVVDRHEVVPVNAERQTMDALLVTLPVAAESGERSALRGFHPTARCTPGQLICRLCMSFRC